MVYRRFDEDKYKRIFDQGFGPGSFDAGIDRARNIGRLRVEADLAEQRRKEAERQAAKMTFDDALAYVSEPSRLAEIKKRGAAVVAEDIRNDPRLQEQIKSLGFGQKQYIDAMMQAVAPTNPDGSRAFRSEREYKQFAKGAPDRARAAAEQRRLDQERREKEAKEREKREKERRKQEARAGDRDGIFGFLDRTVGRASQGALGWLLGDEFVDRQNEMYRRNAEERKANPDANSSFSIGDGARRADDVLKMVETTSRDPVSAGETVADIAGAVIGSIGPYGAGYRAADGVMRGVRGLRNISNPLARDFTRGAIAGGAVGTGLAGTRTAAGEDMSAGDYAKLIGGEALIGGAFDAGIGVVGRRIAERLGRGEAIPNIAREENIPESDVERFAREFEGRTFNRESSGTVIDPNAPRLSAPEDISGRQIPGRTEPTEPLGINEPTLYSRPNTGREVNIEGTPQLNAPERPQVRANELDDILEGQQDIFRRRQAEEDAFVQARRQPIDELFERVAQADQQWQRTKQARDEIAQIKDTYGKIIIPESNWSDWGQAMPAGLRAKRGSTQGVDIYRFADDMGFSSPDEAIQYLRQIDQDSKLRLKDIMPEGAPKGSHDEAIESLRQEFQSTDTARGLDETFDYLMGLQRQAEEARAYDEAEPLRFSKEKGFTREPISYTGRMDPKDQSAVRSESGYSTEFTESPSGDTLRITPEEPLEFRQSVEFDRGYQRGVREEINNARDWRQSQTQEPGIDRDPVQPSGNAESVGVTPGRKGEAVSPIAHTKTGVKGLADKILKGKVNLSKTKQAVKTHISSRTQLFKDIEREIASLDADNTLKTLPDGSVSVEDSFYKATRGITRSTSQAVKSIERDYGKVMNILTKGDIKPQEFDEYALAVHARDVIENNRDKMVQAGELAEELENIESAIRGTSDKARIAELSAREKEINKELSELVPYMLPEHATEDWINGTLAKWKNSKEMKEAHNQFISSQNKDVDMLVQAGIISRSEGIAWKKAHPNYISMRRNKEDYDPVVRVGALRKFGSDEQILPPLESAVLNRAATIRKVNENLALQRISKLSKVEGQKWFRELDPESMTDSQKERAIKFKVDGEDKWYEVPAAFKNTWDNLTQKEAENWIIKAVEAANTVIRMGATRYNMDFILRSIAREGQHAVMASRTGMHPGDLVLGFMDSFLGDNLTKLTGGKVKSYKDVFKEQGGDITGYISMDYESANKFMKDFHKGKFNKSWDIVNPLRWIETFGSNVENATKLAEFRSARNKGYSMDDAMFEAVDIFDYTDMGKSVKPTNRMVTYLNAAIRGNVRLLQRAKENFPEFAMKGFMYVTLPSLAVYASRYAPGVSDEQRSKLRNMPEYRKNMFWHIPIPDSETIISVPKAHLLAQLFANPAERVLDKLYDDSSRDWNNLAADQMKDMANVLVPPTGIALVNQIIGATSNYDLFMKMPIEDQAMQREADPTKRHNSFTSEAAKTVAQGADRFNDILPVVPESLRSPAKVDHVLKGLTGGTGRDVLDVIDNLIASDGSRPAKVNSIDEILNPLKGYEYNNTGSSAVYNRLYEQTRKEESEGLKNTQAMSYYEQMKDLNKEISELRESTDYTSNEKKKRISELRDRQRRIGDQALRAGILD